MDEKIQVLAYSGRKVNERPKAFMLDGEEITVIEISDMWIEETLVEKLRRRFFIVKGSDGHTYKIYMDEKTGEWFLKGKTLYK